MAALRPKEIGRLALLAPVGLWRDEAPVVDIFGMMPGELVPYLYHNQSCFAAQRLAMLTTLFSDKDDRTQEQVEILLTMSRGFRTVAKFLFPVPENGLERRLRRIEAPALIVWGEHDRLISPIYAGIFREKIANAEVVKIPDTGHVISLESPEPLAEALLRWGQQ
jgi:pimeloyl-ACP methyl ester carboxylesterase